MSKLSFNAKSVAPQQVFDPIPKNWYLLAITASELKPTAKEGGQALNCEFTVLEGEFKGRKVFDRFNIKNKSAKAAEIGQQQLSAICHAIGVFVVEDSAQLHNKPFQGKIGLEDARWVLGDKAVDPGTPGATEYEARNNYRGCKPVEGGVTAAVEVPAFVNKGKETPPPPKGKTPPPPAAKEVKVDIIPDERAFFVFVDPDSLEKTGDEVREMLAEGMPRDTPVVLQEESSKGWKTVGDYGLDKPHVAPAAETAETQPPPAAGAKKAAPWLKKK